MNLKDFLFRREFAPVPRKAKVDTSDEAVYDNPVASGTFSLAGTPVSSGFGQRINPFAKNRKSLETFLSQGTETPGISQGTIDSDNPPTESLWKMLLKDNPSLANLVQGHSYETIKLALQNLFKRK